MANRTTTSKCHGGPAGARQRCLPEAARGRPHRLRVVLVAEENLDRGPVSADVTERQRAHLAGRPSLQRRSTTSSAQELGHDAIRLLAYPRKRSVGGPAALSVAPVPPPRVPHTPCSRSVASQQRKESLENRAGCEVEPDEQAARPVVILQYGAQLVAPAKRGNVEVPPRSRARQPQVADAGGRCHHDPSPGDLGAPAQIDVLAEHVDIGIEAAERPEEICPHERAAARHGEHLPHLVVLGLVELAGLDALDYGAEAVDAEADLEQAVRGVPLDQLRADDAGVGSVRLPHHAPDRVRRRGDVVVADEKMRGAFDGEQRLVRSCRESPRLALPENEGAGKHRRDTCGQLIVARGVDHEHVEVRIVLSAECIQTFLEPPTWVIGDHHGDDRRDLLLRHQGHNATAHVEHEAVGALA